MAKRARLGEPPLAVVERVLDGLAAHLAHAVPVAALAVERNPPEEVSHWPLLGLLDADSVLRPEDLGDGLEGWVLDLAIEGHVAGGQADLGPALWALWAATWRAIAAAPATVPLLRDTSPGPVEPEVMRDKNRALRAQFLFTVELRFDTERGDPFTAV